MGLREYAGAGTRLPIDILPNKLIFGKACVDLEGCLSSEELAFDENREVSAKIFAN
jgi:hypothetical protein